MLNLLYTLAQERREQIIALRHHFHAHPELSFLEFETTKRVARELTALGYENLRIGAGGKNTGVVAELNSHKPGPCFALRADMDALPMKEDSEVPYKSQNPEAAHACGHDAHTAILLGAAGILKEIAENLPGKVRFIFQPSEESPHRSGARVMIAEGVLDGVDAIGGLHVWASVPSGVVGYRPGALMASADEWECTVFGKGGHGAMPHEAVDPVVAASQMVGLLQTVISREINPLDTAVLTVGRIEGGTTFNIIPDKAFMQGTVRTFDPAVREAIPLRMERIFRGLGEATRCKAEFHYKEVLPPTMNDEKITELARQVALELTGSPEKVRLIPPTMGAEDMSLYLQEIPGAFLFLGIRNEEKGITAPQHHPKFNVDDDVLPLGSALLAGMAWKFLTQGKDV